MRGNSQAGFTLQELMIAVALIAIILVSLILGNVKATLVRTQDLRRKSDLANLRKAIDEYLDDYKCYPESWIINECNGNDLKPYIDRVPCDPGARTPYYYFSNDEANFCQSGYRLCTHLHDSTDPDIVKIGCSPVNGCGWGEEWNYCISVGSTVTADGFVPEPTVTPHK